LGFQPGIVSILFAATMNGVCVRFRMSSASWVCGWKPSFTSTTRMAISASAPPRERSVENEWCPGVSMNSRPGRSKSSGLTRLPAISEIVESGTAVAPMCWVIAPASPAVTAEPRTSSSRLVFP
jgi:hypothetical protein